MNKDRKSVMIEGTPTECDFVWAVIYKYTNKITGLSYVGQTINETDRKRKHIQSSYNPKSKDYNTYFHNAIRKYGIDNFTYEILYRIHCPKFIAKEILNHYEKENVKFYDTYNNGHNLTKGGDGVESRVVSAEERINHSKKITGMFKGEKNPMYGTKWNENQKKAWYVPILQYSLDGKFIKEYESMKSAANIYAKGSTGNLTKCCKGERKTAYGYVWKYKNK